MLLVTTLALCVAFTCASHVWLATAAFAGSRDGAPVATHVYLGPEGSLLVALDDDDSAVYVISGQWGKLGFTSRGNLLLTPIFAYVKNPLAVIAIDPAEAKTARDPKLTFGTGEIGFLDSKGRTVRLTGTTD